MPIQHSPSASIGRALAVTTALLMPAFLPAQASAHLPVEVFFAEPDIRSVELSPDGKYLAFLTTVGTGKVGIALMHLDTGKIEPLVGAKDENISFFFWKGGDRVVYGGDLGGNESAALRSINISKRKVVALAESYRERYAENANYAGIIDQLRFDPDRILIQGNKGIGSYNFGLWTLDVRTGERWPVGSYEPKKDLQDLAVDNKGVVRGRSYLLGDKCIFEVRPEPESRFVKVAEFPANNPQWRFERFAADNENLYLISTEKTDTGVLHTLNVRTRRLSPALFHTPDGEIENILRSWDHRTFYGVRYVTDRARYHFTDSGRSALQQKIDASLPDTDNQIVSTSEDEKKLVILASSDRDPGTYYFLNLRQPALMAIGKVNRRINPVDMRPMEPVTFAARDGLVLHGYLTRPAAAGSNPVPLIINPHGGPFGIRDEWGFNPEVQLLANQGYAVLQINYRGSGAATRSKRLGSANGEVKCRMT